jgi:hypothetical protein
MNHNPVDLKLAKLTGCCFRTSWGGLDAPYLSTGRVELWRYVIPVIERKHLQRDVTRRVKEKINLGSKLPCFRRSWDWLVGKACPADILAKACLEALIAQKRADAKVIKEAK